MARIPMKAMNEDAPAVRDPSGGIVDVTDVPGGYTLTARADGSLDVRGTSSPARVKGDDVDAAIPGTGLPRELDHLIDQHREDVDHYFIRTRDRVGAGIQIAIGAPGPLADLVCVAWFRKGPGFPRRAAFCPSLRACLDHVNAYEDIVDTKGEEAAVLWQKQQRVQSEAAAIAKRDELARAKGGAS
jgi:hypothetical protein